MYIKNKTGKCLICDLGDIFQLLSKIVIYVDVSIFCIFFFFFFFFPSYSLNETKYFYYRQFITHFKSRSHLNSYFIRCFYIEYRCQMSSSRINILFITWEQLYNDIPCIDTMSRSFKRDN